MSDALRVAWLLRVSVCETREVLGEIRADFPPNVLTLGVFARLVGRPLLANHDCDGAPSTTPERRGSPCRAMDIVAIDLQRNFHHRHRILFPPDHVRQQWVGAGIHKPVPNTVSSCSTRRC